MTMIQVQIDQTGKGYGKNEKWSLFNQHTELFVNMERVKDWMKETYGKCKRSPMYMDKNGKSVKIGYVFSFHNDDISHVPVNKWIQRDWVSFSELTQIEL
jgi:hypothetical protein